MAVSAEEKAAFCFYAGQLQRWCANSEDAAFIDKYKQEVRRTLGKCLTERMCQIYEMYYLEGVSSPTIAEELGISSHTVCETLRRAVAKIKKLLGFETSRLMHILAANRNRRNYVRKM